MAGSGMSMMKLFAVGIIGVLLIAPHGEAAISCNVVYNTLYPCLNFVINGGTPQASCCKGIKSLYRDAKTTGDRQSVCACLKNVASSGSSININNAAALPGKCGVSLPYKISPTIDCSRVS